MQLRKSLSFLVLPLSLFSLTISSQVNTSDLRTKVAGLFENIELENKILFINVWKSDNFESRDNTKEFVRVSKIYEYAKLKNGLKGVCFINISLDDPTQFRISLKKDSVETRYCVENSDGRFNSLTSLFDNKPGNLVIGFDGEVLANNLKKEDCFYLFRSLITR